ncbi:MAG: tRNA (N6-isopentenyl adenosine(37)-C2)-methylthiotransferase MiaB [Candidatus Pacebacteria bacterium]|nr:tRNA (N6-isopentenyl adenosine(37)-C2)-methylthiotransferase MiaB [Candidatus Paceibacterota bacterium]
MPDLIPSQQPSKRLFVQTHGCQMNVYDSSRMVELLEPLGYQLTEEASQADLLLLNSCHIREKASEKLFSELGRWRDLRKDRINQGHGRALIAVAGCVAQAEGQEILRRAPFVDIVVGPQSYPRLAAMVAKAEAGQRALLDTEFPAEPKFDSLPALRSDPTALNPTGNVKNVSAFLAIQEGCDRFCSFCVVPFTRGAEYSRPVADIVREAKQLVAAGARDITLLGQNVNGWHGDDGNARPSSLGRLARILAEIPNLKRIRYMTSHPSDVDMDLIIAHGELPQLMPFLHLPVQSGSDSILAAMNRSHSVADFMRSVDLLRQHRPDMAFSSDFIVGFPGESDADFKATLELVRAVRFAQAYSFKYSPRPGTLAASLPNPVEAHVQDERLQELQALIQELQDGFNDGMVGDTVPVLFEKEGRHSNQIVGKTPWLQPVVVEVADDPDSWIGLERNVTLESRMVYSFKGQMAKATTPEIDLQMVES